MQVFHATYKTELVVVEAGAKHRFNTRQVKATLPAMIDSLGSALLNVSQTLMATLRCSMA